MKYPSKESATLEFKRKLPSKQQVIKTIVAFCNQHGGKLVVGADDDGSIYGVDESEIDDLIDSLNQSIFQSCTPTILPSIYSQRFDDKLIIIIEVTQGMNRPYFVTSLGMSEGVFIRAGANTMKADAATINELNWLSKGLSADESPIYSAPIEELDLIEFKKYLDSNRRPYQHENLNEQLIHYKLAICEHQKTHPTIAALLLFGKNTKRYLPEAFVICTHFKGTAGREVVSTTDATGSLLNQAKTTINWIHSRLNHSFSIDGNATREQALEIPEEAIREIVINAIVHRDYTIHGPIKVAIYDDRIEIFSPGGFPGPLDTEHLEMGITYIRNHIISRIFREAGLVEKLGSGFLTLFESYRNRNLPKPKVVEGMGYIKCILPRPSSENLSATGNTSQDKIMNSFYLKPELTVRDVIETLSVSRQTASRYLSKLVDEKRIERVGNGPSVFYRKI